MRTKDEEEKDFGFADTDGFGQLAQLSVAEYDNCRKGPLYEANLAVLEALRKSLLHRAFPGQL